MTATLPIVFLHGHTLDNRMWQPQLEAFKEHLIYAPNLRGYGNSSPPNHPFSFADDVHILLEEHQKVHLVGLSLGGNIALEIAIRYPNNISTLTLLDSSLKGFAPDQAQIEAGKTVQTAFEQHGLEAARQAWLGLPLFAAARENPVLAAQLRAWVANYSGWHWAQKISPSEAIQDISSCLDQIKAKTLIVVGANDVAYFQNVAQHLHQSIVNSKLEVITKAGHMVNLEQPEIINQLLAQHFL
jgi:3-oxoadipate enol-lactonase